MCIQTIVYPVAILVYILIGTIILGAIERRYDTVDDDEVLLSAKLSAVETILRKINVSENALKEILNNLTHLCANLEVQNASNDWDFLPTFYFVVTVITTIGNTQNK